MNENKNAHPAVGAAEQASENKLLDEQNIVSGENDTTEKCKRQTDWVFKYLPSGKENAIPGRELANRLGVNLRTLTAQIERERGNERLICASQGGGGAGYYIATSPEELEGYIGSLNRRIHKYRTLLERLSSRLADWQGQENIWGNFDENKEN